MDLKDIIRDGRQVITGLEVASRWDAIRTLVEALVDSGQLDRGDFDLVLEGVTRRETTLSTGIGNGIALPHAITDRVSRVIGAIGLSRGGIPFDAVDGQPVTLIVLFLVPKGQSKEHLDTLASIARLLNRPEFRQRLESSPDAGALLETIRGAAPAS